MSEPVDIRRLLREWPYDPQNTARIVRGEDGREILQIRTPLGLEQLELQGRPDGARPHGWESALEFHQQRLANARAAGQAADFELSAGQCAELFDEGTLYYGRYLHLFQLKRWAETVRDTARNLRLFDFVRRHAARQEDRDHLEKWRPYIVRLHAAAAALQALDEGDANQALALLQAALDQIAGLDPLDDETFHFEQQRSEMALKELLAQIQRVKPVSPLERLERELRSAIELQEFERAAELRDRIRKLRKQSPSR